MERLKNTIQKAGNYEDICIAVMFTVIVAVSFINETIYEKAGRYMSLFMFFVLGAVVVIHIDEIIKKRDFRFVALIFIGIAAMTNLILLGSNKGAVLIPTDLALIVLVSGYARLREKTAMFIASAGSILTIIWYCNVRWSYNFNMAGLTFMLFMIMGIIFVEMLKERTEYDYLSCLQILMFITAFIYATLYHSRCAMAGIISFGIFYLGGFFIRRSRVLFTILLMLTTVGSIAFTIFYIILAGKGVNINFLYKELLSGRQQIWKELWKAFCEHPLTGIGSSYNLQSFDIFEVHNGFLDLLVVHGLVVFFPLFILILTAVNNAWISWKKQENPARLGQICIAAVFSLFVASFFENGFITPPYSAFFLYFLLLASSDN